MVKDVVSDLTQLKLKVLNGDLGMGAGRLLGRTSQLEVELSQIKRKNHMTKKQIESIGYNISHWIDRLEVTF